MFCSFNLIIILYVFLFAKIFPFQVFKLFRKLMKVKIAVKLKKKNKTNVNVQAQE